MHTSAFHSCRIHHNGDYDGDIYITNEDSTSQPIGNRVTIRYTCRKLINLYKKIKENRTVDIAASLKTVDMVTFKGIKDDGCNPEITILVSDR